MASIREFVISVVLLLMCIVRCPGTPLTQSRRVIPEENLSTTDPVSSIDESRNSMWDDNSDADGFDLDASPWLKQSSIPRNDNIEQNFLGDLDDNDDEEEGDDDDDDDDEIEETVGNNSPVLLSADDMSKKSSRGDDRLRQQNSFFVDSEDVGNSLLLPSEDMAQKDKREDIIGQNSLIDDGNNIRPIDEVEEENNDDEDEDEDDLAPYSEIDEDDESDIDDTEMFNSQSEDSKRLLDDNVFLF